MSTDASTIALVAPAEALAAAPVKLPRVQIVYCTQCRWLLRAAYFGQELLSTFGTAIGEVALIPATGGIFTVHLTLEQPKYQGSGSPVRLPSTVTLWDRKVDGGFPETKVLKQRLRDHIEPDRHLGHSDVHGKVGNADATRSDATRADATTSGSASSGSGAGSSKGADDAVGDDASSKPGAAAARRANAVHDDVVTGSQGSTGHRHGAGKTDTECEDCR